MLSYALLLTMDTAQLDNRDIRTRNHGAILIRIEQPDYFKCYQDPVYRGMSNWNNLDIETRNAESKPLFLKMIKLQIINPYTNYRNDCMNVKSYHKMFHVITTK